MAGEVLDRVLGGGTPSGKSRLYTVSLAPEKVLTLSCRDRLLTLSNEKKSNWQISEALLAACRYCNCRERAWGYAAEKNRLVSKRCLFYNPVKFEEMFARDIDDWVRDYIAMEGVIVCLVNVPPPLTQVHQRTLEQVWRVISYFELKDYCVRRECGEVKLKASLQFAQNKRHLCQQSFLLKTIPGGFLLSLKYLGKEPFSKPQLKSLGIALPELSISMSSLRIRGKIRESNDCIHATLELMQKYMFVIATLCEKDAIECKMFPIRSASVIRKDLKDGDFAGFLQILAEIYHPLPPLISFISAEMPESWKLESFSEVKLKSSKQLLLIQSSLHTLRTKFLYQAAFLPFQNYQFYPSRRVLLIDFSLFLRVSSVDSKQYSLPQLETYCYALISAVKSLHQSGFEAEKLHKSWFINRFTGEIALFPFVREREISIFEAEGYCPATYVFKSLENVPAFRQKISFSDAMSLLPAISPLEREADERLFLSAENESENLFPLYQFLRKKHWFVSVPTVLRAVLPASVPILLLSRTSAKSFLFLRYPNQPATLIPLQYALFDINSEQWESLLNTLDKLHSQENAHLMLIPPFIQLDTTNPAQKERKVLLRNAQISDYAIRRNFGFPEIPLEWVEFIDPSVLGYLYWSVCTDSTAQKKKQKCQRQLTPTCDVYSVGMLIYSYLWQQPHPFAFVNELEEYRQQPIEALMGADRNQEREAMRLTDNQEWMDVVQREFAEYFQRVVQSHRSPLISEVFEKEFPRFTDTLRRCFMRPISRPKVSELAVFICDFPKMRQFIREKLDS